MSHYPAYGRGTGMDREAAGKFIQTILVRTTVEVFHVKPRRPDPAEEPIVKVKGVADLSPNLKQRDMPLWYDAEVHIHADRSFEIISFTPSYGAIQGVGVEDRLTKMYEHAFIRALESTDLKIIGVR